MKGVLEDHGVIRYAPRRPEVRVTNIEGTPDICLVLYEWNKPAEVMRVTATGGVPETEWYTHVGRCVMCLLTKNDGKDK